MSNFILLLLIGLIAAILLLPFFGWLCDNRGELDFEKERKLTEE